MAECVDFLQGVWLAEDLEEWRDIAGYEGSYQVSNLGNVRSVDRIIIFRNGRSRFYNGAPLRISKFKTGKLYVNLWANGIGNKRQVHRLVAEAYLPNPDGYPVVRHLDDNSEHNNVENLAWGTHSENVADAIRNGLHVNSNKTHCKYGHELAGENLSVILKNNGRQTRRCRICLRRRDREYRKGKI